MIDSDFDFIRDLKDQSAYYRFPNNGVMFARLPSNILSKLRAEAELIKNDQVQLQPWNKNLVGHIRREYAIPHCIPLLEDYVRGIAASHDNIFSYLRNLGMLSADRDLMLQPLWINLQQKHEYNPPHSHSGVYSFVIWLQIPYDLDRELARFPDTNSAEAAMFNLMTTNIFGRIECHHIPVDRSYEGVICLFPSQMMHYVNPFYTSDDLRISVSGNLLFDVGKDRQNG
jgi:Putative 2OG-Fe(II) oxygenase